jgi:putative endonuclease
MLWPLPFKKLGSHKRGLLGERLAACWYRLLGYHVLERRLRTPVGEIDLLVANRVRLVAVEVKTRLHTLTREEVSPAQRERITRALSWYQARHPRYQGFDCRMDVVGISGSSWPYWIPNAWGDV